MRQNQRKPEEPILTPSPAPLAPYKQFTTRREAAKVKAPARKIPRHAVTVSAELVATVPAEAVADLLATASNAFKDTDPGRAADADLLAYCLRGGAQTLRMGEGRDLILSYDPSFTPPQRPTDDAEDDPGQTLAAALRQMMFYDSHHLRGDGADDDEEDAPRAPGAKASRAELIAWGEAKAKTEIWRDVQESMRELGFDATPHW